MFSVTVFYDERVVIVAEQRPDASEEDSFQWMSRVLQVRSRSDSTAIFGFPCDFSLSLWRSRRPSTASIRWAFTVWLWCRPTPSLKPHWAGSTSLTPSSTS